MGILIMEIYCCGCNKKVDARLTNGIEIYFHREDLQGFRFGSATFAGTLSAVITKRRTERSH
jgi:hypothetical protein